jgi:hypothetical protein
MRTMQSGLVLVGLQLVAAISDLKRLTRALQTRIGIATGHGRAALAFTLWRD